MIRNDSSHRTSEVYARTRTRQAVREHFGHYALRFWTNPSDAEAAFFLHRAWWKLGDARVSIPADSGRPGRGGERDEWYALAEMVGIDGPALDSLKHETEKN